MKKIVSLVLVMLMVFSFASISFAAADAVNCVVTIKKGAISADNKMNVDFVIDFPEEISTLDLSMTLQYDKSALKIDSYALDGGIEWSIANSNVNFESDKSFLWFEDTSYTGSTAANRLTVSVVFSVLDSDTTKHGLTITSLLGTDAERWDTLIAGYTVKEDSAPAVKTITKTGTDVLINDAREKSEGITTAEQIGGAAGFAFTIPEGVTLDDNMIWSLTTSDGKKFSQKVNAGLSALSGPVKVAATFVTGSHLAGEGRTPFNFEITAANGIFKAGEDFYFTDAADAKAQLK